MEQEQPENPNAELVPVKARAKVPKRIKHAQAIEKAELYAAKNLAKYLKKLHELAMGVVVIGYEGEDQEGNPVVVAYKEKPDLRALQILVDRGMGKVVDKVEITGEEGGPIGILPWIPGPELIEGEAIAYSD